MVYFISWHCILQNSAKYHMIYFQLWSAWWYKYIHPWITFLIIKSALSISALPKYLSTSRPLCQTGTLGNFFARRRPFDKGALIHPGQRLHPPPKWVLPKYTEHFYYWLMSKSDRWWRWQVRFPSNSSDTHWLAHYKQARLQGHPVFLTCSRPIYEGGRHFGPRQTIE